MSQMRKVTIFHNFNKLLIFFDRRMQSTENLYGHGQKVKVGQTTVGLAYFLTFSGSVRTRTMSVLSIQYRVSPPVPQEQPQFDEALIPPA